MRSTRVNSASRNGIVIEAKVKIYSIENRAEASVPPRKFISNKANAPEQDFGECIVLKSKITMLVLALAILTTLAVSVEDMGKYSINLATNDTLGTCLVNQSGFTLYYFMNDAPGNSVSSCSGKCAALWPAFYAETLTVPMG